MARNSWVQNQGSAELKDGADQFRFLSDQVADFGALAGVKIVPYRDPSLPLFSDQPLVSKYKIIDDLKVFVRICNAVLAAGGQLNDSVALCWSAIKELGLRPASDLFTLPTV